MTTNNAVGALTNGSNKLAAINSHLINGDPFQEVALVADLTDDPNPVVTSTLESKITTLQGQIDALMEWAEKN